MRLIKVRLEEVPPVPLLLVPGLLRVGSGGGPLQIRVIGGPRPVVVVRLIVPGEGTGSTARTAIGTADPPGDGLLLVAVVPISVPVR